MTLKEALKRIELLEIKVRRLEAKQTTNVHYHFAPYQPPVIQDSTTPWRPKFDPYCSTTTGTQQ